MRQQRWRATAVCFFLFVGGMMYLLWRPKSLLLFAIADRLNLKPVVNSLRASFPLPKNVPEWVLYSLPGALWAVAYLLFVDHLHYHRSAPFRAAWGAVIPFLGILSELLQMFHLLPGTFDLSDIACYGISYVFYVVYLFMNNNKTKQL